MLYTYINVFRYSSENWLVFHFQFNSFIDIKFYIYLFYAN